MADFDKAFSYLPEEWPATQWGHNQRCRYGDESKSSFVFWAIGKQRLQLQNLLWDLNKYDLYDKENTGKYQELFWERQTVVKKLFLQYSTTHLIKQTT